MKDIINGKSRLGFNYYQMVITIYCDKAYEIAKSYGWHEEKTDTLYNEVSEGLVADRKRGINGCNSGV